MWGCVGRECVRDGDDAGRLQFRITTLIKLEFDRKVVWTDCKMRLFSLFL